MTSDQDNLTPPPVPPPTPAAPIPQQADPYPMPALPYSSPVYNSRPGILTAVSVMSIIIACISAGGSLLSGCTSASLYGMASGLGGSGAFATSVSAPAAPQNANTSTSPSTMPVLVTGVNGLGADDRQTVLDALGDMQPISDPRKEQLEAFLAEHGQNVFPTAGRRLTAAQVKAGVSSSQTVAPTGDENGAISFVTQWGALNVDDNQAAFFRTNSPAPLVTKAHADSAAAAAAANPFAFGQLTAKQVQSAVSQANSNSGNRLNAAQIATLTTQLQSPQQEMIRASQAAAPIRMVTMQPDGESTVQFSSGSMMSIDAKGVVTSTFNPMTFGTTIATKGFGISRITLSLLVVEALLSLALAVLLLVGGIMVLRESSMARRLHRIYAWVKIPAAVLFGSAGCLLAIQFGNAISPAIPGSRGNAIVGVYTTMAIVMAAASCIYPVALLLVFRMQAVRAYYSSTTYS